MLMWATASDQAAIKHWRSEPTFTHFCSIALVSQVLCNLLRKAGNSLKHTHLQIALGGRMCFCLDTGYGQLAKHRHLARDTSAVARLGIRCEKGCLHQLTLNTSGR